MQKKEVERSTPKTREESQKPPKRIFFSLSSKGIAGRGKDFRSPQRLPTQQHRIAQNNNEFILQPGCIEPLLGVSPDTHKKRSFVAIDTATSHNRHNNNTDIPYCEKEENIQITKKRKHTTANNKEGE